MKFQNPIFRKEVYATLHSMLDGGNRREFYIDGKNSGLIFDAGSQIEISLTTPSQTHRYRVNKDGYISDYSNPQTTLSIDEIINALNTGKLPDSLINDQNDLIVQEIPTATDRLLLEIRKAANPD